MGVLPNLTAVSMEPDFSIVSYSARETLCFVSSVSPSPESDILQKQDSADIIKGLQRRKVSKVMSFELFHTKAQIEISIN